MAGQRLREVQDYARFFYTSPFDTLTRKEQEHLLNMARVWPFASGEVLFAQGEVVSQVAYVFEGKIKLSSTAAQGKECILHIIRPFSLLDIAVLFYEDGLPYSAIALTDGLACLIDNSVFRELLEGNPVFSIRCLRFMTVRQRLFMNKLVASQGRISVACRVSSWLLHRSRMEHKDILCFDIGRELMARLLGVTRESLSRELSRLAELGYILVEKRCITLLDKQSLEKIARM